MNPEDDRRAAIEAAFEATTETPVEATTEVPAEIPAEVPAEETPAEETPAEETPAEVPAEETPAEEVPVEDKGIEKPPQSWKPAEKAKWAQLDPDIRQEVIRRERQVAQVLNETAQVRGFANELSQAIQPYQARIKALGGSPTEAISRLFQADYVLTTAPKAQRAQFMAQLIKDCDVDIESLDKALSGQPVADPVDSRVEQLVQERLAPFQQFLTLQQQREAQQREREAQRMEQTIEQMRADPRFPYFDQVREAMADLIEFYALKKNVNLDIESAYNQAVMTDPVLSKKLQTQTTVATQVAQAQRAKKASVSVSGTPAKVATGSPPATDRRAIIEQAFEQLAGR